MPGSDFVRLVFSKRTCYRVYAVFALLTRLLFRLIVWVLEVGSDLDAHPYVLSLIRKMLPVQEFEPWVKWVIMDAALAYFVGASARHYLRLAHFYQAIGWM